MTKKRWYGFFWILLLIGLVFAIPACAGQRTNDVAGLDSEVVTRDIKVYESPT